MRQPPRWLSQVDLVNSVRLPHWRRRAPWRDDGQSKTAAPAGGLLARPFKTSLVAGSLLVVGQELNGKKRAISFPGAFSASHAHSERNHAFFTNRPAASKCNWPVVQAPSVRLQSSGNPRRSSECYLEVAASMPVRSADALDHEQWFAEQMEILHRIAADLYPPAKRP